MVTVRLLQPMAGAFTYWAVGDVYTCADESHAARLVTAGIAERIEPESMRRDLRAEAMVVPKARAR